MGTLLTKYQRVEYVVVAMEEVPEHHNIMYYFAIHR
jgi:hypothetical protein